MKRHRIYLSLLCLFFSCISSSVIAQTYHWVKGGGSTALLTTTSYELERSYSMCVDGSGNIYSLNQVGSSSIGADTFSRSAYGNNYNILVTSYNCTGQMRWAKLITSASGCRSTQIIADTFGHIYISGGFNHIGGAHTLYIGYDTSFSTDLYKSAGVMQLDTAGDFKWIRLIGQNNITGYNATSSILNSIVLDSAQNVHLVKLLGNGAILPDGLTTISGTYDMAYDANGNYISTRRLQLDSTLIVEGAIMEKITGKLYCHGSRSVSYTGLSRHYYIAAFDTARNTVWMDTIANGACNQLVTDNHGIIYAVGGGNNYIAYHRDTVRNPLVGYGIGFVMKLDTANNVYWMRGYSSTTGIGGLGSITMIVNNKLGVTGTMAGRITADVDTVTGYSGEGQNNYFSILDTSGHVHTIQQIHGNAFYDGGSSISSDRVGNLYIGGYVGDSVWMPELSAYHTVGGNSDFFIMKYGMDCSCTSMPMVAFTYAGSPTVTFNYSGTTAGIDSVRWTFGDGGTSTSFSPSHAYTAPGTYHVVCAIYSTCGNDERHADVYIPCVTWPAAAYTVSGTTSTRSFTYTGSGTGMDSVVWNFGDGSRAVGLTATHTYTALGTYTVCVSAYNPCGSSTFCNTTIVNCLAPLTASFTHSGMAAHSFTYTGTTTGLDSVVWHYGDGGRGTGLTSSHTYAIAGSYTACALAYNQCGVDSTCSSFTVPCVGAPIASFASSGVTATRSFTYTGTTVALDSVVWNFGDGGRATGLTASHTYAATGTYAVCVISYNPCGSDTACSSVAVTCLAAPTASYISSGTSSVAFTYTGTSVGLDSVVWHLGDGGHATGLSTIHSYAMPDTYTVCVAAYNQCGWDSSCSDVVIPCFTPVSSFTSTGMPTVFFTFTGTSTGVDSVIWDYADGYYGSGLSPVHTYTSSGTYYVCAIVHSMCGNDTFCANVTVICPLPLASFTYTGSPAIDFTCGTLGSIDSVRWYFGDGNTDTGITAAHGYATSGTYNVCMIVYNLCGADTVCEDVTATGLGVSESMLANIQVYPNPATDEVTISGLPSPAHYKLTNIIGQTLLQGNTPQGNTRQTNTRLHLTHLSPGLYFLHLTLPNNTHHLTKLIIQ